MGVLAPLRAQLAKPTVPVARRLDVVRALWTELGRLGRFALAGLLAALAVTLFLGSFLPAEVRRSLVAAEARGLIVGVESIEDELPPLDGRSALTPRELASVDALVRRSLLGGDRVRVKLWALDGTVLYSDETSLIGRRFEDALSRVGVAQRDGVYADVTDLGEAEHVSEGQFPRLVEYYVAVHDPATGRAVAVIESYEDVQFLGQAVGSIELVVWISIAIAVALLVLFLVVLMAVTLRSLQRERSEAVAHARDLDLVAATADSLALSLDPSRITAAVAERVSAAFGLSRFEIAAPEQAADGELVAELTDGSWLLVERPGRPLTHRELATLRSAARLLDAARSNAQLLADVREAALDTDDLAERLDRVRDDERRRLVLDLHDSLAGELVRALYAVRRLEAGGSQLDADLRHGLEDLRRLVESSEGLLRSFMGQGSPSTEEDGSLSDMLDALVASAQRETGLRIQRRFSGDLSAVPGEVQLTMLRVVNEALLNVQQHASAELVRITVRRAAGVLLLTVDDDGHGWPKAPAPRHGHGFGLGALRDRVAQLGGSVRTGRSRLGGARLAVRLPLEP